MSMMAVGMILQHCFGLNPTQKAVLTVMADCGDTDHGNIFPSIQTISLRTGYSEETVKRIRRELRNAGVLVRTADGGQGPGATATYRIDCNTLLATFGAPKEGSVQARVLAEMLARGRQVRLCHGHPLLANKGVTGNTLSLEKGVAGDTLGGDKGVNDSDKGVAGDTQTPSYNQEINPPAGADARASGEADKQQACSPDPAGPGEASAGGAERGSLASEATAARVDPSSLRQRWVAVLPEVERMVGRDLFLAWVAKLIPWRETESGFAEGEPRLLLRAPGRFQAAQLAQRHPRLVEAMARAWGGPVEIHAPGTLGDDGTLPPTAHDEMTAAALKAVGVEMAAPGERRAARR